MWYGASPADVRAGKVTDVCLDRAIQVLRERNADRPVVAEITASGLPDGCRWAVLGGVEEMVEILAGRPMAVFAMPEGTVFRPGEPVVRLCGSYCDLGEPETAALAAAETLGDRLQAVRLDTPSSRPCGEQMARLLQPLLHRGEIVAPLPGPSAIRDYCIAQVREHVRLVSDADLRVAAH